eukprot:2326-Heterococcus_DN1.PRE.2
MDADATAQHCTSSTQDAVLHAQQLLCAVTIGTLHGGSMLGKRERERESNTTCCCINSSAQRYDHAHHCKLQRLGDHSAGPAAYATSEYITLTHSTAAHMMSQ